ncbi:14473_t:CDS:2, partial [Cetraspora pellucida]
NLMALVLKNKKCLLNDNDLTNKNSKRIRKITQYLLGLCEDMKAYNVCQLERLFKVLIDKFEIAKEIFEPVNKFLFTLSGDYDNITIPETETRLTKLFALFKINLYLMQICDETLAKKQDLTIEDVLINPSNIEYHQFKESIKLIIEYLVVIPCDSSCESIIYNIANLCFIIPVDYMNFLYQTNINNKEMPYSEKIKLEVAYTPDSANYSTMKKMTKTLKNKILESVLEGIKASNDVKEFKNIFINKPILDNNNKQIPENLPNESDESNNNEQLSDELDEQEEQQLLEEQEDQIPDQIEEQEKQQILDNIFLIKNLKKAIKDSNLNNLFLNEQIYKDIINSLLIFEEKNEL